jgi:N-carbamoyl-L-amino-acid hydrolase
MSISIDTDRLRDSFETYAAIGATDDGGLNRPALSDADGRARDQFCSDLRELGLEITIDEVGNIFGRQTGEFVDKQPVLIGSHLDSQPRGGRYDGQLGIVVALETMRAFDNQSLEQKRPLEIVNWTNEEGARFSLSPLGSGVFGEIYTVEQALAATDSDGVSVAEALKNIEYDGNSACEPHDIRAHLELHIEQGPKLDRHDVPVGVVDAGVGMTWWEVTISGQSNHAGTTPMYDRSDALTTAARVIAEINSLPTDYADDVVITVGELAVSPDVVNVVPGEVVFTLDVRSPDDDTRAGVLRRIKRLLEHETTTHGTTYEKSELLSMERVTFSPVVREHAIAACDTLEIPFNCLTSGAGHDAMCLAEKTETGMIFAPSVNGVSHTPQEYTKWSNVLDCARVFAETTLRLACD